MSVLSAGSSTHPALHVLSVLLAATLNRSLKWSIRTVVLSLSRNSSHLSSQMANRFLCVRYVAT